MAMVELALTLELGRVYGILLGRLPLIGEGRLRKDEYVNAASDTEKRTPCWGSWEH